MSNQVISKKIKNQLLQKWDIISCKERIPTKKYHQSETKDNKKLIAILYRLLIPVLDKTLKSLGIKFDQSLIDKIRNTVSVKEKASHQKKLIRFLVKQFKKFPLEDETFLPTDIQKLKKFNCAGGSLLFARLLEKAKIKSYCGLAFRHSVNIAQLADGSFVYICTRVNLKGTLDYKNEGGNKLKCNVVSINNKIMVDKNTGVKYLMLKRKEIPYRLVLVLPQKEHIFSIIDNMENSFFLKVRNLLFLEIQKFEKRNKLWKNERKYFSSPEAKLILRNKYLRGVQIQ